MSRSGAQRRVLTGWGGVAPSGADVLAPVDAAMAREAVGGAPRRGVLARGLGRAYGDAAQNAGGRVLDMTGLAGVRSFDVETGLLDAESGLSLDAVMRRVVPHGWFPHVTPGTRQVTLGGALAADVHGKNHHVDGAWSAGVRSFTLATPAGDGDVLRVTPEDEPDVFAATAGGMGLTGVVLDQQLQLQRIPSAYVHVDTERTRDLDDVMARMIERDHEYRFSVAWIDCLARGPQLGRSVLTRGDWAPAHSLPVAVRSDPHGFSPGVLASAPRWMPSATLNALTVAAFNEAWYRKAPAHRTGEVQSIAQFFHPLDAVSGWNAMYGRAGFVQYQFVVPDGAEATVRRIVEALARTRTASFLAVLKRFGAAPSRFLSFPQQGWTLALDLPMRRGLAPMLRRFDEWVAEAGGRIYLAKDSCLTPELLPVMYPQLDEWREVRDRLDPDHRMTSDLDRRLDLTGRASG